MLKKLLLTTVSAISMIMWPLENFSFAQTGGQIHSGNVLGNPTASESAPQDATLTSMFDRVFGSTSGFIPQRGVSAWTGIALPSLRPQLTIATTFYVNPAAFPTNCNGQTCQPGSDNNACTTIAAPCLTIAHAISLALAVDANLKQAVVQISDGGAYQNIQITSNMVGAISGGDGTSNQLTIQGNCTTPTNTVLTANGSNAFTAVAVTSPISIRCLQISGTGGHGIEADFASLIYYDTIVWGPIDISHNQIVALFGSKIEQQGVETISGGAASHWYADRGSQILLKGFTVTCSGAYAFTSFVNLINGSIFTQAGTAFSGCGSITGAHYAADNTSTFGYGTADPNTLFPGSTAGSVTGWAAPLKISASVWGTVTADAYPIFGGSGTTATTTNSTQFVGLSTISNSDNNFLVLPETYTLQHLQVFAVTDPGNGQTLTITLRIGGAGSAISCVIVGSAGGGNHTCSDLTHTATAAQTTAVSAQVASSNGAAATIITWSVSAL